jgi:acyl-CoA thioesterase FadM
MGRIRISFPDRAWFTYELPLRISDINYGNHLGHDALVSILHEVRMRFLRSLGMSETDVGGVGMILGELAVTYRNQAFYGDVLRVEVAVGGTGSRGCDLLYRVTDLESGNVVALARTGLIFFDYEGNKVAPMPEVFRKLLRERGTI